MLVLSRHRQDKIQIGPDITITVVEIRRGVVRLGIDAPDSVHISRPDSDNQQPSVQRVRTLIAAGVPLHEIEGMLDREETDG